MKILILSDSHGDTAAMRRAVEREQPERVFHLGDVSRDAQRLCMTFPGLLLDGVVGNCDSWGGGEGPDELLTTVAGVQFFLTHGHRYRVKMGTALLLRAAQEAGAEVACFGHTHQAVCKRVSGLWLVNPGSIGGVGAPATYAVAEAENGAVEISIKYL